jgi:hypothetical protein
LRTLEIAALALNAALYAGIGYALFLAFPLVAPGSPVRFWPQVIIPAVFAALFGSWVGGLGAGIGIFISDMLIHGNALLSLMAGVPSNFVCFALIGYLTKENTRWRAYLFAFGILTAALVYLMNFIFVPALYMGQLTASLYSAIIVGTYAILFAVVWKAGSWRGFEVGSMVGLLLGSAIIGAMVTLFTHYFVLPGQTSLTPFDLTAGIWQFSWTFLTEIPFLIILGPPILRQCYKAFPSLQKQNK